MNALRNIYSTAHNTDYAEKDARRKTRMIAGIAIGAVAVGIGSAYLAKSGKLSILWDNITQKSMMKNLRENYGDGVTIQKGQKGSLFIPSEAAPVPEWRIDGKTDFDRFIKRYGLTAIDDTGKEIGK